jgi:hypothetical protein
LSKTWGEIRAALSMPGSDWLAAEPRATEAKPRKGLFEAMKGTQSTVLASATPPKPVCVTCGGTGRRLEDHDGRAGYNACPDCAKEPR